MSYSKNLWKRRQHITRRHEKEGESPNLHEPEDPVHPAGNITRNKEDARNIITQALVNRSRYEWDEGNYEDEEN
jgi:hypothetical protein